MAIGLDIIITVIDQCDEQKKKEEIEIIDGKIEDKSEAIARELLDKELEKIIEECK